MEYNKEKIKENVKLLTLEENLELIALLVDKAEQTVQDFCNIRELTSEMSDIVEDVACYRYNLIGNEGINSEGIGSGNVNYNQDLPLHIKSRLVRYRRIRVF